MNLTSHWYVSESKFYKLNIPESKLQDFVKKQPNSVLISIGSVLFLTIKCMETHRFQEHTNWIGRLFPICDQFSDCRANDITIFYLLFLLVMS